VDPGALSGKTSRPSDGYDNGKGESMEDLQGAMKGTSKEMGTKDGIGKGMWKGMWKGKGNSEGKGIVKQTPGEDLICCIAALQLQKQMYEAHSDMEG